MAVVHVGSGWGGGGGGEGKEVNEGFNVSPALGGAYFQFVGRLRASTGS